MSGYHITGFSEQLGEDVRRTMRSPEYGHAATHEIARGTGPCRICLRRFHVGAEGRILFTYRPPGDGATVGAPGPVFIHAEPCGQYRDTVFPPDLHSLPIVLEARASGNRVPHAVRVDGYAADAAIADLLAHEDVDHVDIRHGEAGCHIARVSRGPLVLELASESGGG